MSESLILTENESLLDLLFAEKIDKEYCLKYFGINNKRIEVDLYDLLKNLLKRNGIDGILEYPTLIDKETPWAIMTNNCQVRIISFPLRVSFLTKQGSKRYPNTPEALIELIKI